ncbi:MAG: protein phosphatase 2C domain-containing protein [Candidatus Bruticola sp.]
MICPTCGCDNNAEDLYCDECGAQLKLESEENKPQSHRSRLLEEGQIVWNHYRVGPILQADSDCIFYELTNLEPAATAGQLADQVENETADTVPAQAAQDKSDSAKSVESVIQPDESEAELLLCTFPSDQEKAEDIFASLSSVEHNHLWPLWELKSEENTGLTYLIGPRQGMPLRSYLQENSFNLAEITQIGCDILSALKILHSMCKLFNGVSLDSVWITPDKRAVLTRYDRVVAKFHTEESATVIEGFSSPEAYGLEGGELTRRSDIFSVGALLFYLLTGRTVSIDSFESNNFSAALRLKAKALTRVIARAIKRDPQERWLSASEMAEALSVCSYAGNAVGEEAKETVEKSVKVTRSVFGGYTIAKKTSVGAVRKVNQDAYLELMLSACERDMPSTVQFVGVIDGMGGEAEGDKAASLAARSLAAELVRLFLPLKNDGATTLLLPENPEERDAFILEQAIKKANETIFNYACKSASRRGMGCTISCVLLDGDRATFGHVGDTRAYRMGANLDQVTTDHSVVGQLVQMGTLTREEARRSPKRSIIYRALGTQPDVEVDIYRRVLVPGEYLMISSDGVWEYYTDEELLSYFQKGLAPAQICEILVNTCLERGADDNTTVAIIRKN